MTPTKTKSNARPTQENVSPGTVSPTRPARSAIPALGRDAISNRLQARGYRIPIAPPVLRFEPGFRFTRRRWETLTPVNANTMAKLFLERVIARFRGKSGEKAGPQSHLNGAAIWRWLSNHKHTP